MLKITMFSQADSVKGLADGSANNELIALLKQRYAHEFDLAIK